jgi:hypothetical protein
MSQKLVILSDELARASKASKKKNKHQIIIRDESATNVGIDLNSIYSQSDLHSKHHQSHLHLVKSSKPSFQGSQSRLKRSMSVAADELVPAGLMQNLKPKISKQNQTRFREIFSNGQSLENSFEDDNPSIAEEPYIDQ